MCPYTLQQYKALVAHYWSLNLRETPCYKLRHTSQFYADQIHNVYNGIELASCFSPNTCLFWDLKNDFWCTVSYIYNFSFYFGSDHFVVIFSHFMTSAIHLPIYWTNLSLPFFILGLCFAFLTRSLIYFSFSIHYAEIREMKLTCERLKSLRMELHLKIYSY